MNDSYIYIITFLLPISALMLVLEVNPYHALILRGILGAVAVLVYTILGAADVALTEALVGTLLSTMLCAVAVRSSLVFRLGVLADQPELLQENELEWDLEDKLDKKIDESIAISANPLENSLENSLDSPPEYLVENLVEISVENLIKNLLENSQPPQETNATELVSNSNLSNFDLLVSKLKIIFNKHHMQVELIPYAESGELDQALINKEIHAICVRSTPDNFSYQTKVRLRRLYEIIKNELDDSGLALTHLTYVNPALDLSPNSIPNSSPNSSPNLNPNLEHPFPDPATTPPNSEEAEETHL